MRRQEHGARNGDSDFCSQRVIEKLLVRAPPKRVIDDRSSGEGGILQKRAIERYVLRNAIDVHVVVFPRVRQVRQIFVRTVEINVVVVIAIEEITDLKGAAQADEMTNGIGMPESDVGGVIGAKTRTTNANPMGVAFAPGEIENVTHN